MSDQAPVNLGMDAVREAIVAARLVKPAPGSAHDGTGPLDLPLSRLARNDIGNAERFRARLGEDFRFLRKADRMVWDGHRWDREAGPDEARKGAQLVVIAIRNEANALERQDPEREAAAQELGESEQTYVKRVAKAHAERVDALRRHANSLSNGSKLGGMLREAAPLLTVTCSSARRSAIALTSKGNLERRVDQLQFNLELFANWRFLWLGQLWLWLGGLCDLSGPKTLRNRPVYE